MTKVLILSTRTTLFRHNKDILKNSEDIPKKG